MLEDLLGDLGWMVAASIVSAVWGTVWGRGVSGRWILLPWTYPFDSVGQIVLGFSLLGAAGITALGPLLGVVAVTYPRFGGLTLLFLAAGAYLLRFRSGLRLSCSQATQSLLHMGGLLLSFWILGFLEAIGPYQALVNSFVLVFSVICVHLGMLMTLAFISGEVIAPSAYRDFALVDFGQIGAWIGFLHFWTPLGFRAGTFRSPSLGIVLLGIVSYTFLVGTIVRNFRRQFG